MKRTFVLFAKKAMVYALTAAMLLATPLTASAAEADDSGAFGDYDYVYDPLKPGTSEDPTGTITNTNTGTTILDGEVIGIGKDKIKGIYLTPTSVDMVKGEESWEIPLKATIVMEGVKWEDLNKDQQTKIQGMIRWETSDYNIVSIRADENDRRVVYLCGRGCGTAKVTCKIVNVADGDRPYVNKNFRGDYSGTFMEASATVNVKEYIAKGSLSFNNAKIPDPMHVKQIYNMQQYLLVNGNPYSGNDKLTWFVTYSDGTESKDATIDGNGALTIKKVPKNNKKIKVNVATELGVIAASKEIAIDEGTPANKVEILVKDKTNGYDGVTSQKETTIVVETDHPENEAITVKAVMTAKDGKSTVTDTIRWESKKTTIVDYKPLKNNGECELIPVNVGKTTITAIASSGKKATLNVIVTAPLKKLKITNGDNTPIYTGQTIHVDTERSPKINADKLNYTVDVVTSDAATAAALKKCVSIDKNGNLKVTKPLPAGSDGKIKVTADNKKNKNDTGALSADKVFVVETPDIKAIKVTNSAGEIVATINANDRNDKQSNPQTIDINQEATFKATVTGTAPAESLQWTSSSTKVATVDNSGLVKALKAGTATIKVSGTYTDNGKAKTITAQFKVTVMQPAESVKLNKSLVIVNPGVKKDVSVAFTASVTPSNSDKDFTWDLQGKPHEEIKVTPNAKKTSAATVTITKDVANDKSMLGKDFDVIAMNKRSGAYATAKIQMVNQTKQVVLTKNGTVETALSGKKYKVTNAITNITPDLEVGKSEKVYACVYFGDPTVSTADEKNYRLASDPTVEDVTWTIAKAGVGYVNVIDNGDGSFSIYGLRPTKSAVTITFTTASKKKVNVKVKVVAPAS